MSTLIDGVVSALRAGATVETRTEKVTLRVIDGDTSWTATLPIVDLLAALAKAAPEDE